MSMKTRYVHKLKYTPSLSPSNGRSSKTLSFLCFCGIKNTAVLTERDLHCIFSVYLGKAVYYAFCRPAGRSNGM